MIPTEARQLAAIMFTDMVGYSALAQRDEALALELLEEHRRVVREILARFHGTEIKTIGDAFLLQFRSALEAVQCAIEVQRTFAKRNHDFPRERRIELKIGIHLGDVVHRDGDLYGDGVNIASRIEPLAGAGGICISEDVERQVRSAVDIRVEKLAPAELKNIQLPIALFRIVLGWEQRPAVVTQPESGKRAQHSNAWIAALILLALVAAAGFWWLKRDRSTSPTAAAAPKSIAVLPFVNLSAEKENEHLSDGITEDLCTALTQVKGLRVAARTSSFVFKGKTEDIRKIGEQLNVATVLEGSVSKAGNKLRIAAQLINVADGYHLWATNYDREMTDILEIRSDISKRVVDALKLELGIEERERLIKKPTENLEAYELYLLGRHELNKFTESGFAKSIEYFKKALVLDPKFALANAGLAEAYNNQGLWNYLAPKDAFPEAKRAAEEALRLDPSLAEARTALAFIQYEYEWQFAEAERQYREAIRLNPGSAAARFWFGEFLVVMGRFGEGEAELEAARLLDPLSVRVSFDLAVKLFFQRQFDRALEQLEKTIARDPQNGLAYDLLGQILWKVGRPAEAFSAWQKVHQLESLFTADETAEMRTAYGHSGLRGFVLKQIELMEKRRREGKYQSALRMTHNYIIAGEKAQALDWLERAVEERATWMPEIKIDPTWDDLRSEPRFIAVLEKIGLEK